MFSWKQTFRYYVCVYHLSSKGIAINPPKWRAVFSTLREEKYIHFFKPHMKHLKQFDFYEINELIFFHFMVTNKIVTEVIYTIIVLWIKFESLQWIRKRIMCSSLTKLGLSNKFSLFKNIGPTYNFSLLSVAIHFPADRS